LLKRRLRFSRQESWSHMQHLSLRFDNNIYVIFKPVGYMSYTSHPFQISRLYVRDQSGSSSF
jgi:hypothetical protein